MPRPPLSYYGGKQKMARHILPIIDSIPHTVYGEPFCGGASVFFLRDARSGDSDNYREYLNDKNQWVTTFYRVGKTRPDELVKAIDATLYSEADHCRAKAILKDSGSRPDLDVAWAVYVQCNMSFGKQILAGWATSTIRCNQASGWNHRKATLPDSLARLSRVAISSSDAIDCIKRWDSPHTLHYLDPPYPGTDQGHYGGYTVEDFEALCDCLDNIQGSYVLSNYHQGGVAPQSAQEMISIDVLSSAGGQGKVNADRSRKPTQAELGNRKRTEVLWVCDRSANMRPDIVPLATKHVVPRDVMGTVLIPTESNGYGGRRYNQRSIFDALKEAS